MKSTNYVSCLFVDLYDYFLAWIVLQEAKKLFGVFIISAVLR